MSIIADRGLFVRLPAQPDKCGSADAVAFADAIYAARREPATKDNVVALRSDLAVDQSELEAEPALFRAELKQDIALLGQRMDAMKKRLDARIDALGDRSMLRIGGLMIAPTGVTFAALRLTQP